MRKARKLLSAILAFTLGVGTTTGFVACNKEKHTHVWSTDYVFDAEYHWFECDDCGKRKDVTLHVNRGEGVCDTCNAPLPTEDVSYELSVDGTYASVTGYEGFETALVIANTYEGVPVTHIMEEAFDGYDSLIRVDLPDSITTIGDRAFSGCSSLEGIRIPLSVTYLGEEAFDGCSAMTYLFCEAESEPTTWHENWKSEGHYPLWGYNGKRMTNVSPKAVVIGESVFNTNDNRKQITENNHLIEIDPPEPFSILSRFDAKTEGAQAWGYGKSALWNYHYDNTNLQEYSDVWFAVKIINAQWTFVDENTSNLYTTAWAYFHLQQVYVDRFDTIFWKIEVSFAGNVWAVNAEQSGKYIDKDRATNSLARMLWDDGFASTDKMAMLIYATTDDVTIYCTEIVGIRKGYR